ncbi:MAG: zinc ribbon domain-containing protein [Myxococcales bacterium]
MNCPNCQKSCDDGVTFCPHCDAVLDTSFLGGIADAPDGGDGEDNTPVPEARPARPSRKPAARPRRRAPIEEREPEPEPEPRAAPVGAGKYDQYWTDDEPPVRQLKLERKAESPAEYEKFESDIEDPGEQIKALWSAFLGLHFEDKLTAACSIGLFVMSFMPWRSTPDSEVMGFLTWGFLCTFASIGALAAIWIRKAGKLGFLPRAKVPFLSTGAGTLAACVAALSAVSSYETTSQLGARIVLSSPSFGVFLSLLAACGVVVGGVLTARRER